MRLSYRNLDKTKAGRILLKGSSIASLESLLTAERVKNYQTSSAAGWIYNYAAKAIDEKSLALLEQLAEEQQVLGKYKAILDGVVMNPGEGRMVLHHLTRGVLGKIVRHNRKDIGKFYAEQNKRIAAFSARVHSGAIKGSTGKPFETVVQVGIGGSDLGPRAMFLALEQYVIREKKALAMKAHFISNVDPDDAAAVLASLHLDSTLFILVSKSGTTQETLANENFVREALKKAGLDDNKHMVAVTSETSPLAKSPRYLASFYIDDFIGGRYSSTSAVGGAVMSLSLGADIFARFLAGAHEGDKAALEPQVKKNAALLDALIGVWERNALKMPYTAVLPYSQALSRLPAHLQQLDMESNGKSVNRANLPVKYGTGPVLFGEPGTNGQHSFYQELHQGTDRVPLQFIGFQDSQSGLDVVSEGSTSQVKLKANLAAQIVAFAKGSANVSEPNKNFAGNRPSSLLLNARLTPETLGALLSHFENKVMFQGLLWNINSFDQEGVQLGKVLTKAVLAKGAMDPALKAYSQLLGL
jgi:glucose-6-phosphate isomerase